MPLEIQQNELVQRIEKLEHQIRLMKRVGIAIAGVLALLFVLIRVQRHYQTSAQAFVLTDSKGQVRAKLAMLSEGPGLEMYAASGERRVELVGGGEDAALNLYVPGTTKQGAASVNLFQDEMVISSWRANPSMASLEMHSGAEGGSALLSMQSGAASLTLAGSGQDAPKVSLEINATDACTNVGGTREPSGGSLCFHSPDQPVLELANHKSGKTVHLAP